ncbi:hypothetical protein BJX61DRAFT_533073 [Aspergillus egyptiacus]|nr:hypothetical protein BJX61DRAFT_533073 [Aspergillus egyptiacus]
MQRFNTTDGRWEYLEPASNLFAHAFDSDPILRYLLCNLSDEDYVIYLRPYWKGLCRAALLNGGVISEVDGWKSAGIMLPPGKSVDNPWMIVPAALGFVKVLWRMGISGCERMLCHYSQAVNAAKRRALNKKQHYYLFALGTEWEHQGKGLARALIECYQNTAWGLERPIWLEATTAHSRDIYLSMGFEIVEAITLGEGIVAENGTREHGGPGVTMWAMVWWPNLSHQCSSV